MIVYGKNIETGKYHKIDASMTSAELSEKPEDRVPEGFIYGGPFRIVDGILHFLPDEADKVKPKKKK